jgi:hypothetical protein
MRVLNWKLIIVIALIGYGAFNHFNQTSVQHFQPAQQTAEGIVLINGYEITPLEPFEMQARILSTKKYTTGKESDLVPVDLALGWGKMADPAVTNQITITQSNRWYHWQVKDFPIPRREIETNSANMHLIPGSPAIAAAIKSVKVGQMVKFSGDLVEANDTQAGWRWKSSLSREDTGAGACELVLVKSFNVL